jgi:predicted porin
MRLVPIAAAILALAAGAAHAQSSVTIFGIVDVGYTNYRGDGNGHVSGLTSDGYQSSRLGFRGVEDLGGGLKAGFWLEAAIQPDSGIGGTGNTNNQASGAVSSNGLNFNRRSTLSLMNQMGELRLGRDFVPGFRNLSEFNPFGTNGVGSSGYLFYPVQSAARITNVRASNSIAYFTPSDLGGFYGTVMYAMGENASNSGITEDDGRVAGIRVGYKAGPLNVAAATNRTDIASLGDFRQTNIGASYDFKFMELNALYNENKVGQTKIRSALIGALIPAGPGTVRVAYAQANASGVANDARQLTVGYVYDMSKRTALYTNYSRLDNRNNGTAFNVGRAVTTPGGNASGFELGIRHSF